MSLYRPRPRQPSGAPELCLPTGAQAPPIGPDWIHEIKHDGFRILARRAGPKVLLISRNGHDMTYRFPLIAGAVAQLPVPSCERARQPGAQLSAPVERAKRISNACGHSKPRPCGCSRSQRGSTSQKTRPCFDPRKRPAAPACPASKLVRKAIRLRSVRKRRSRAIHFAGSQ
jgi:ATP dependent DNA ligase domain